MVHTYRKSAQSKSVEPRAYPRSLSFVPGYHSVPDRRKYVVRNNGNRRDHEMSYLQMQHEREAWNGHLNKWEEKNDRNGKT